MEQRYPDLAKLMNPEAGRPRDTWSRFIPNLDQPAKLPDGTAVPLKDLLAAEGSRRLGDDA